ncbi:hypothetical protein F0562_023907 [Nyssa sinensis]|uniref:Glycosyltransferase 61 catalytic domain-containing protein n=1 Tax=Nyssa sinensis TaxID=561372 RepID=A0A5J5BHY5_9ASTE|nr:hypothetical protein F0562_023907 [Nyssa sinensis]
MLSSAKMTYETIFARSFSRHDQKKFGCGAFVGCLIIAFSFCTVFKPLLGPLPVLNLHLSFGVGLKMLMTEDTSVPQQMDIKTKEVIKPICDFSERRSDVCEMNGDTRIHGNSSTIFVASTEVTILAGNSSWSIKPYARKGDEAAMGQISKFTIKMAAASQDMPYCTQNHSVPAIVFSTGGYAGNHFHDFTDVVIPLYLTSREFNGEVQFLITNKQSFWINKYRAVIQKLSRYEIIDIDREDGVHCFPSMIVGLKHHKELGIDHSRSPYSMKDFRQFLRSSYSLKRETAIKLSDGGGKRPRLLIISRRRSRSFMNEGEITDMARSLGFDVVVKEAHSNLSRFAQLVNSCDVIMGVHGAGLTNIVFLPENAILIQVVPLGGVEWVARIDFGEPAKDMKLRYLEYKIGEKESSLIEQYPVDHQVFRDPYSIHKQGWVAFRSVYLDKQNVKLDVGKFRSTLLEALQLLHM